MCFFSSMAGVVLQKKTPTRTTPSSATGMKLVGTLPSTFPLRLSFSINPRCNKRKPIPSKEILEQWNSSYRIGYNRNEQSARNEERLSQLKESKTTARSFPRHQPEFDPADYREHYNYQSTR